MKTNKYVEELRAKSAAALAEDLVAAKKELFNLRFQNEMCIRDSICSTRRKKTCACVCDGRYGWT